MKIDQSQRDKEIAAVNCRWLEPCGKSRQSVAIECLNCGRQFKNQPAKIKVGQGCPTCSRRKAASKRAAPQKQRDKEALRVNCIWLERCRSAKKLTEIRCLICNYEWKVIPDSIRRGSGCPMCAPNSPVSQEQRDAEAAAVNCKWLEPCSQNHILTRIKCLNCQHKWKATPANIHMNRGCPSCAKYGTDYHLHPSLVYLLKDNKNVAKIGITRKGSTRISKHEKNGWQLVKSWKVNNRSEALTIEKSIIDWWRNELNLPPAYQGLDGWTETVSIKNITLNLISAKIDSLLI